MARILWLQAWEKSNMTIDRFIASGHQVLEPYMVKEIVGEDKFEKIEKFVPLEEPQPRKSVQNFVSKMARTSSKLNVKKEAQKLKADLENIDLPDSKILTEMKQKIEQVESIQPSFLKPVPRRKAKVEEDPIRSRSVSALPKSTISRPSSAWNQNQSQITEVINQTNDPKSLLDKLRHNSASPVSLMQDRREISHKRVIGSAQPRPTIVQKLNPSGRPVRVASAKPTKHILVADLMDDRRPIKIPKEDPLQPELQAEVKPKTPDKLRVKTPKSVEKGPKSAAKVNLPEISESSPKLLERRVSFEETTVFIPEEVRNSQAKARPSTPKIFRPKSRSNEAPEEEIILNQDQVVFSTDLRADLGDGKKPETPKPIKPTRSRSISNFVKATTIRDEKQLDTPWYSNKTAAFNEHLRKNIKENKIVKKSNSSWVEEDSSKKEYWYEDATKPLFEKLRELPAPVKLLKSNLDSGQKHSSNAQKIHNYSGGGIKFEAWLENKENARKSDAKSDAKAASESPDKLAEKQAKNNSEFEKWLKLKKQAQIAQKNAQHEEQKIGLKRTEEEIDRALLKWMEKKDEVNKMMKIEEMKEKENLVGWVGA